MGIFWGQEVKRPLPAGSVWRADLDGSNAEQLAVIQQLPGGGLPTCMAIAPQAGKLYWSDDWTDDIRRVNFDGSNLEVAVEDAFIQNHAVGVDELVGKVYWIEAFGKTVRRSDLDGSNPEDVSGPLGDVWGIALSTWGALFDFTNQKLYLHHVDFLGDVGMIIRSDLDGSNFEQVFSSTHFAATGMALDLTASHLYWVSSGPFNSPQNNAQIMRCGLDGSNPEVLVENLGIAAGAKLALDLPNGTMYWTISGLSDENPARIDRADLTGANVETIVDFPQDVVLGSIAVEPLGARKDNRFEYAAKLICGQQRDFEDTTIAPGFYATVVNVHNPNADPVTFFKKLALAIPPGRQRPGAILPIAEDTLAPDETLAIDCSDLQQKLFPDGLPAPFVDGFVVVQSPKSLDVTAVYTTAAIDPRGKISAHSSIHVLEVRERDRGAPTDLSITKEARYDFVDTDRTTVFSYNVVAENHGPETAANVVVKDLLAVEVGTLLGVVESDFTSTHGGVWTWEVAGNSVKVKFEIPSLPALQKCEMMFAVVVLSGPPGPVMVQLNNAAAVESATAELNPSNNTVVVKTVLP